MPAPGSASPELARRLGLIDVVALGINAVIGSGIFLLPGKAAAVMGPAALVALGLAGVFSLLVALCFAEVAGRFSGTGAAYLYTAETFGPFAGFQVGWLSWVVRVISWAALANGVAVSVAAVVPSLGGPWGPPVLSTITLVGLALANVRGARLGANVINTLTVAKLAPLAVFLLVGGVFVEPNRFVPFAPAGFSGIGEATLLVLWAFAGFENVAVVAGETTNPQRTVPRALLVVMLGVLALYLAVFALTVGLHPALAGSDAPVAEAAEQFLGPVGGALVGAGIAVSVLGTTAGTALIAPRFLYAMAQDGHLPAALARLHPTFHTPVAAIALSTVLSVLLAVTGSFEQLVVISVVARFAQFVPTCLAVLVLRARDRPDAEPPPFRIPGGPVVPVLALALCAALLAQAPPARLLAGGLAILSGLPVWAAMRALRRRPVT